MPKNESSFTVFFDPPFWVGLYRRQEGDQLSVCKITFGAEPRDSEVYEFLLNHWRELRFSPAVTSDNLSTWPANPKRRQREIRRELERSTAAVGTKAQQALQAQREAQKEEGKRCQRERKELETERRFFLRQEKRKKKHKGH